MWEPRRAERALGLSGMWWPGRAVLPSLSATTSPQKLEWLSLLPERVAKHQPPPAFCCLSDWIPRLFTTTVTTTTATTMAPATTRRSTTAAAATTAHVLRPDAAGRPSAKTSGVVSTRRPTSALPATTRRKPTRQPPTTKKPSRPCDSHPCLHGGTCEDDGTEFTCSCPAGKGGAVCEKRTCLPPPSVRTPASGTGCAVLNECE